jgi:F-type H+-transporting ATPase subunit b
MPQLDLSTWPPQLVWLAITFFALYYVISRIAIPRTGGVIELRKNTIESDLAQAQKLRADTDAAVKSYEAALAEARAKAQAIAMENRNTINAQIETERSELDQSLAAKIGVAEKRIAASRDSAMREVDSIASEIAGQIVRQLMGTGSAKASAANAKAPVK